MADNRNNNRGGSGNFANDREKASEAGRKGGQASHGRGQGGKAGNDDNDNRGGGGNFANDRQRASEEGRKGGRS